MNKTPIKLLNNAFKHIRPENKFVIISFAWVNKKELLTLKRITNSFQI